MSSKIPCMDDLALYSWRVHFPYSPKPASKASDAKRSRCTKATLSNEDADFEIGNREIEESLRSRLSNRREGRPARVSKEVRSGLKGRAKHKATFRFVGYSAAELRRHIESLFTPGMSWEAFLDARIHLDHVRPLASFDLSDPAQIKEAWAMSNLQPLWLQWTT